MQYLSPTTFIKFLNCEHQVKLLKIDRVLGEGHDDFQSMAMAVGIAFDIMVKSHLNRRFKAKDLLKAKVKSGNEPAILVAESIWQHYQDGPLIELKKEGIGYGGIDQEVEIEWTEQCTRCINDTPNITDVVGSGVCNSCSGIKTSTHRSVLYGQPDLTLTDGTVLDWKVSGAYGRGAKPIDGYVRCYHNGRNTGDSGGVERRMEEIRGDWATQTYLYARLLGHKVGDKLHAGIEYIAVSKENDVYCCSYRNEIGSEFQVSTERKFHDAFKRLVEGNTQRPHASERRCIQYNKLCNVADFCDGYKKLKEQGGIR